MHFFEVWSWCGFLSVVGRSSLGGIRQGIREGNLKKEHFTGQHTKHHTLGGRAYPVRHSPVAIRLRDRKGRAVLCVALFPQSEGLFGHNTRSAFRRTPSPRFFFGSSLVFSPRKKEEVQEKEILIKSILEKLCKYNACICQKKCVPLHHKLITYHS